MALIVQYIRWSSKEQTKGDSLRRQQELIQKYLKLYPDDTISPQFIYIDKGVSSFKKKPVKVSDDEWIELTLNRATGDLSRLFEDIQSRKIPRGSKLLVETFDRLSRAEPLKALNDITTILNAGVTIVTLNDMQEYNSTTFQNDMSKLMIYVVKAWTAHEESLKKSDRGYAISDGKHQKYQKDKKPMKLVTPGWISRDPLTDTFVVDEAKAAIVRSIFAMRIAGDSFYRIAIKLNESRTPTINGRMIRTDRKEKIEQLVAQGKDAYAGNWSRESIKYLLLSETVIGTKPATSTKPAYQNYYPAIIDLLTFKTVQDMSKGKPRGKCSATDSPLYLNIFRTLIECGECGLAMTATSMRPPVYFGVYRCNGFLERRQVQPTDQPPEKRTRGAGRIKDAVLGDGCRTAPRKTFDLNLCKGLFAYLQTITGDSIDKLRLNRLEQKKSELETVIANLTQTIVSLAKFGVPDEVLKEMESAKQDFNQVEKDIKSEYLKAETLSADNLGKLDLLNSKEDRSKAQAVISKLVRKIIVYGSRATCDIHLYNGSVIVGFQYLEEYDATYKLTIATDDDRIAEWNMISGVTGGVYVNAGKPVDSLPQDFTGWPDADEPDYPNTDE